MEDEKDDSTTDALLKLNSLKYNLPESLSVTAGRFLVLRLFFLVLRLDCCQEDHFVPKIALFKIVLLKIRSLKTEMRESRLPGVV